MVNQDLNPLNDEQLHAVRVLLRSTERTERLIEDLILFSMTERGEVTLYLQATRLNDLFTSAIEQSREKANNQKVQLNFICPSELPVVESYSEKLLW